MRNQDPGFRPVSLVWSHLPDVPIRMVMQQVDLDFPWTRPTGPSDRDLCVPIGENDGV